MLPQPDPRAVFLNIPYDDEFQDLYLAYIVGLCHLGLEPRLASEIPGGERRLNRILTLVQHCRYSLHDLSRVEVAPKPNATPRFNMPLELGIAVTWTELHRRRHTWFVFEAEPYRLQRSASDLNGTDPNIHYGTPVGVLAELRNAFLLPSPPAVQAMLVTWRIVQQNLAAILANAGTQNVYSPSVFRDLRFFTLNAIQEVEKRSGG